MIRINRIWNRMFLKYREPCLAAGAFLIALLPRLVIAMQAYPVLLPGDEVCTFGYAAYLAGYDWKEVMGSYGYYGFGYSIFLTPLYWLFDDAVTIYRAALAVGAALQAAVVFPCYYVLRKIFGIRNIAFCLWVSVTASYLAVQQCTGVLNEYVLGLGAWAVLIILLKLEGEVSRRARGLYTLGAVVVCAYMYTVHTRGIVYLFLFIGASAAYTVLYRRKITPFLPLAAGSAAAAGATGAFIRYIQQSLSNPDSANASLVVRMVRAGARFRLKDAFFGFLNNTVVFMNNIHFFTAGISVIAAVILVRLAWQALRRREEGDGRLFLCGVYAGAGILGFALALSYQFMGEIQQIPMTGPGMPNTQDSYSYIKGTMLIRYCAQFFGILFLLVSVYLYQDRERCRKLTAPGICLLAGSLLWEIRYYVPGVQNLTSSFLYPALYAGVWFNHAQIDGNTWLFAMHVFFCLFLAFMYLLQRKKVALFTALAGITILCQYYHLFPWHHFSYTTTMSSNYEKAENGCALVEDMKRDGLVGRIFLIGVDETNNEDTISTKFVYQFVLYDCRITSDFTDRERMPALIFSRVGDNSGLLGAGYQLFRIGESEYAYVGPDSGYKEYVEDFAARRAVEEENVED